MFSVVITYLRTSSSDLSALTDITSAGFVVLIYVQHVTYYSRMYVMYTMLLSRVFCNSSHCYTQAREIYLTMLRFFKVLVHESSVTVIQVFLITMKSLRNCNAIFSLDPPW